MGDEMSLREHDFESYLYPLHATRNDIKPNMHINPRFMPNIKPHFNKNFKQFGSLAPHINPIFYHVPLSTNTNNQFNKIHINPKLINIESINPCLEIISKSKLPIINNTQPCLNKLPLKSRYKYIKRNNSIVDGKDSSKSEFKLNNKSASHLKINKYKLVSLSKKLPEVKVSKSPHRIWKSQNGSFIVSGKYKLQRKRQLSGVVKETKIKQTHLTPVKQLTLSMNIVNIRGTKFIIMKNQLRMIHSKKIDPRFSKNNVSTAKCQRICVNGQWYVRKSPSVFTKEICTSRSKLKKNNIPCPIFRKFGECRRKEKSKCVFLHDKKHINICRKFLSGQCNELECRLSHNVSLEKMPTCNFFLQGCCVRENCPYLHVKVNEKVEICVDFIKGYCQWGKDCSKRHVNMCPDFDKYGKCNKLKCIYPHKKEEALKQKAHKIKRIPKPELSVPEKSNILTSTEEIKGARYFDSANESIKTNEPEQIHITRPKLGSLPVYISLH